MESKLETRLQDMESRLTALEERATKPPALPNTLTKSPAGSPDSDGGITDPWN